MGFEICLLIDKRVPGRRPHPCPGICPRTPLHRPDHQLPVAHLHGVARRSESRSPGASSPRLGRSRIRGSTLPSLRPARPGRGCGSAPGGGRLDRTVVAWAAQRAPPPAPPPRSRRTARGARRPGGSRGGPSSRSPRFARPAGLRPWSGRGQAASIVEPNGLVGERPFGWLDCGFHAPSSSRPRSASGQETSRLPVVEIPTLPSFSLHGSDDLIQGTLSDVQGRHLRDVLQDL